LQIIGPNIKFRFIRAKIVNGIKHARSKSAHAKLTKYLLFVKRIGPREPNITINAAVLPRNARENIINDILFVNHSAFVMFIVFVRFRGTNVRQSLIDIIVQLNSQYAHLEKKEF